MQLGIILVNKITVAISLRVHGLTNNKKKKYVFTVLGINFLFFQLGAILFYFIYFFNDC